MIKYLYSILSFGIIIYFMYGCLPLDNRNENEDETNAKKVTDGLVKKVREDGKVYAEVMLHNGKKHGISKNYHKNGKLHLEINYREGMRDGLAKVYYENGNLFRETFYVGDKKNNLQKIYRPDGKLMAEVPYKNDAPGVGLKEYLLDGKPKTKFPEIVVRTENNLLKNNSYLVFISLSEKYKNQEFYVGELSEGKYLTGDKFVRLIPKNGVVKLTYTVPPGAFFMEQLNFICKSTTILGNPYITQKKYNLSIEHLPL